MHNYAKIGQKSQILGLFMQDWTNHILKWFVTFTRFYGYIQLVLYIIATKFVERILIDQIVAFHHVIPNLQYDERVRLSHEYYFIPPKR